MKAFFAGLLVVVFCVMSLVAGAQTDSTKRRSDPRKKGVFTFHPLGLVNKFRVKWERAVAADLSVGVIASGYYGFYPGVQVSPFVRAYISKKAPTGFYLQLSAIYTNNRVIYYVPNSSYSSYPQYDESKFQRYRFSTGGAGLGFGYQFLAGVRNNIVIDLMVGGRVMFTPLERSTYYKDPFGFGYTTLNLWDITGPASYLNCMVGLGFAF
jgi:hypothetical protein